MLTRNKDPREEKLRAPNTGVTPGIQGEKKVFGIGKMEQRDAMRRSGSVRAVTLSPEAESGLLQHFSDHCVATIVEFLISDEIIYITYEHLPLSLLDTCRLSHSCEILNCSVLSGNKKKFPNYKPREL